MRKYRYYWGKLKGLDWAMIAFGIMLGVIVLGNYGMYTTPSVLKFFQHPMLWTGGILAFVCISWSNITDRQIPADQIHTVNLTRYTAASFLLIVAILGMS